MLRGHPQPLRRGIRTPSVRPLLTLQLCRACSRLAVNWRHRHGTAASRAQDTNLGGQGGSGRPQNKGRKAQNPRRGVARAGGSSSQRPPSSLPVPSQFPDWPLPRFRVRVGVVNDDRAAPSQGGRAGGDTALPRAQRVLGGHRGSGGVTGVTLGQGG